MCVGAEFTVRAVGTRPRPRLRDPAGVQVFQERLGAVSSVRVREVVGADCEAVSLNVALSRATRSCPQGRGHATSTAVQKGPAASTAAADPNYLEISV